MTNYVILLRNNNFSRLPNKIDHFRQESVAGRQELGDCFYLFSPHTPHPTPYTLFQVSGQEITAF
ncbi:hypothetical protein [Microcystis aeruginosa]|uniref:Uncharacterized protein n=1 Tax=Microcystis aeruginosa FD4 TaxID=2686288 RepID=A0A857D8D5_MICAE|nr:hypothetical protein [Microcystis aeruginosa]NCR10590.1 hypothetical protein [Microcystis aeruginosa LG13-11]QGZ91812.1 hypothetical protein GQR42_22090 [Microcystis aeruginosa FD4]